MQPSKANQHWRSTIFLTLRLACAVVLLVWVWKRLSLDQTKAFSWNSLDPNWLILAFLFGGLSVLGWAARWWWFLRVYAVPARYGELLRLTLFADFFNLYFLGPLGADGIRLLLLSRRFPDKRGAIMGSLILDHIGGLVGGVILYGLFSRRSGLPETILNRADIAILIFMGITFLGLGVIMEPWLQRVFDHIPGLRRLSAKAQPIYAGTFRHPWLFSGFAVSALGTACAYTAYAAAARALGAEMPLTVMLGLMPVVDAIASLPITLSGLGVREGLLVEWLGQQPDIGPHQALSISLLGFATLGLWGLIGGVWLAFWRKNQTTA